MENVQMNVTVPLPSRVKSEILAHAKELLDRHRHSFANALLHMRIGKSSTRMQASLSLLTDDGRYRTSAEEWDVRHAVADAIAAIERQIVSHFEQREESAQDMVQA